MTIEVPLADGNIGTFKDGTPDAVVQQKVDAYNAKLPQEKSFLPTAQQLPGELSKAVKSGSLRGVSGMLGLPADIATGIESAGAAARVESPEAFEAGGLAGLIGGGGPSPSTGLGELLGSQSIREGITSITGEPDRPVTGLGKLGEAATEFATGSIIPAAAIGKFKHIPKLAGLGATAGVGSEGAGSIFEGTKLEQAARLGGALIGATTPAGIAAASRRSGLTKGGRTVLDDAVGGLTEEQKATARQRVAAAQEIDVPLAPVEAIDTPALQNLAADVTSTTKGARIASDNLAGRSEAVENAVEKLAQQASPTGAQFSGSEIGEKILAAGKQVNVDAKAIRSAKVDALFKEARTQQVPDNEITALIAELDEAIGTSVAGGVPQKELQTIRNGLVRDAETGLVETRIGLLDEIRQTARERARSGQGRVPGDIAAVKSKPILDKLTDVMEKNVDEFAEGMTTFKQMSPDVEKIANSSVAQLGKGNNARTSAKRAINIVTDIETTNPRQIKQDMATWAKVDTTIPPNLLRLYLNKQLRAAMKKTTAGTPDSAGTKLFNLVAGNKTQRANLNAMFNAVEKSRKIKQGTLTKALETVLTGLEKAGSIKNVGSVTAGRQETLRRLRGSSGPIDSVKNFFSDMRFNRNVSSISDLLTNPARLEDLLALTTKSAKNVTSRDIVRALAIEPSLDEE